MVSQQGIDVATSEDTSWKLQRLELMSRQEIDIVTSRTSSSKLHRYKVMSRQEIDVVTSKDTSLKLQRHELLSQHRFLVATLDAFRKKECHDLLIKAAISAKLTNVATRDLRSRPEQ